MLFALGFVLGLLVIPSLIAVLIVSAAHGH